MQIIIIIKIIIKLRVVLCFTDIFSVLFMIYMFINSDFCPIYINIHCPITVYIYVFH